MGIIYTVAPVASLWDDAGLPGVGPAFLLELVDSIITSHAICH